MAGVSISTVSRALNQSSLVNAETRERIETLARSLKYSMNMAASNLRSQRNQTVGVVLPFDEVTRQGVSDPFFVSLMGSLADALNARGLDMLVSRVDSEQLTLAGEIAASGRAVGVIVIGQWRHHDQLNELAARSTPIVVWGAQLERQLYCTVGGDNISGGSLATAHLIEQGRRRIAFFGDVTLPEIGQRFEGYRLALARHGHVLRDDLVHHTPFIEGSAAGAIKKMRRKRLSFDGIFAASDLLAMESISELRAHGRRVPRRRGRGGLRRHRRGTLLSPLPHHHTAARHQRGRGARAVAVAPGGGEASKVADAAHRVDRTGQQCQGCAVKVTPYSRASNFARIARVGCFETL